MAKQVALRRQQEQDKKYGPPKMTSASSETSIARSPTTSTSFDSSSTSLQAPDVSGSGLPSDSPLPLDLSKNQSTAAKYASLFQFPYLYPSLPHPYYSTMPSSLSSFSPSYLSSHPSFMHLNPPLVNHVFSRLFTNVPTLDASPINPR